jgi:hypothetical protein
MSAVENDMGDIDSMPEEYFSIGCGKHEMPIVELPDARNYRLIMYKKGWPMTRVVDCDSREEIFSALQLHELDTQEVEMEDPNYQRVQLLKMPSGQGRLYAIGEEDGFASGMFAGFICSNNLLEGDGEDYSVILGEGALN